MSDRPILFSGPMVRAILSGAKTQTRRVVKPQPTRDAYNGSPGDLVMWEGRVERLQIDPNDGRRATTVPVACPYGVPGDTLWVRETWRVWDCMRGETEGDVITGSLAAYAPCPERVEYAADGMYSEGPWRPSIFMPRWASRLTLRIKSVRVERLQDISQDDAQAEGLVGPMVDRELDAIVNQIGLAPSDAFRALWDSINGKRAPWSSNPWVWVVEFERAEVRP